MQILFEDRHVVVAVKPVGVLSEHSDSEENMPALLGGNVYPVHRLDRGVGGVMVYAKHKAAAAKLSQAVQAGGLCKEYTAVVSGIPTPAEGELRDLLFKDSAKNKSFVVDRMRKGAKEAILSYRVQDTRIHGGETLSRVQIHLVTGRSHQIRVQFSARGWPLVGDGKYGSRVKSTAPALFSSGLCFPHPQSGKEMCFRAPVPTAFPFDLFGSAAFEIERKYLIAYPDTAQLAAIPGCVVKQITQTYLSAPGGEARRVRRVESGEGNVQYIETVKRPVSGMRAVEEERTLSSEEYEALLLQADPDRRPIVKTRYCLPHGEHTVEVDVYEFWQDRATAEIELRDEGETITLPSYLHLIREISDDPRYKNVNLAKELPVES